MGFMEGYGVCLEADLEPRIVDGRVVLHGNQRNITPAIEAWAREHHRLLWIDVMTETDSLFASDEIIEIKPEK